MKLIPALTNTWSTIASVLDHSSAGNADTISVCIKLLPLKDGRVVFNIAGNKYHIVVWINYPYRVVYIRFIATHRQYDAINAQTV